MADDGIQLHLEAVFYDLWQLVAVPGMSLGVGQGLYCFLRTGDGRRIELVTVRHRLNALHHFGNLIGVGNNNLIGCFLAQISKLFQHFFGGMQIKGRLQICILIVLSSLQNGAQLGILRIEKMHVAGGHNQLAHAFAQLINPTVMLLELLLSAIALPH